MIKRTLAWWTEDKVRQFTVKMWTWRVLMVLVIITAIFLPKIWGAVSILWVTYVSHAAMVATHAGNIKSAEAQRQTEDNTE